VTTTRRDVDEMDARFDEEDEFFDQSEALTNTDTVEMISTAWRRIRDEAEMDDSMAADQSLSVYDGDEYMEYVNAETQTLTNGAPLTLFRYDGGEEHDWSVILECTRTRGKPIGDPEVDERPTKVQWAVGTIMSVWQCRHCLRVVPAGDTCLCQRQELPGKMRRYQVGVDHDSDAGDGRFQAGVTQWVWLKVPRPTSMDIGDYAEAWAKAHCFSPVGVESMKAVLMTWYGQGITHIRVQYLVPTGRDSAFPKAGDYLRVEKFYSWDDCKANMRLVQAANRARRAASSDEYVPERVSTKVDPGDIEDLSL
jgi:hypothetical protein